MLGAVSACQNRSNTSCRCSDWIPGHSSLYEARRGRDRLKLMVKNVSWLVERVWLDE
jgi:hypothetical protein